ncbi:MAG: hypothetical protein JW855_04040 [Gammaproteobacteria bacterium]|nr:hypothetical protein [Gammaproteobacteria bacterium]
MPYKDQSNHPEKQLQKLYKILGSAIVSPKNQFEQKIYLDQPSAIINLPLLLGITKAIWSVFLGDNQLKLNCSDFIKFCIDIYNNVIHLDDESSQKSIIALSISALERGIKKSGDR